MIEVDGWIRIPETEVTGEMHEALSKKYTLHDNDGNPCEVWKWENRKLCLPWSYFSELHIKRSRFIDKTKRGTPSFQGLQNTFLPRKGQSEAVEEMIKYLIRYRRGVLTADCGSGKSIVGAQIAYKMKMSTLVLVHREFLEDQWKDNIRKICPEARIGIVRGPRCEFGPDYDFVIASCQSLVSGRAYPWELYDSFGFAIADEVHIYSARSWNQILGSISAKYRLGLTATYRRSDGLIGVIKHHIGDVGYHMKSNSMKATVFQVETGIDLEDWEYIQKWDGKVNFSWLKTKLAMKSKRNRKIAAILLKAIKSGRRILVLSDRKDQLKELISLLMKESIRNESLGLLVGGLKPEKRKEAESKQCVFSTYHLARNALDIDSLDVLILATPINDIQQPVGRVVRRLDGKKNPLVIDFVDKVGCLIGQARSRKRQYESLGYEVKRGKTLAE